MYQELSWFWICLLSGAGSRGRGAGASLYEEWGRGKADLPHFKQESLSQHWSKGSPVCVACVTHGLTHSDWLQVQSLISSRLDSFIEPLIRNAYNFWQYVTQLFLYLCVCLQTWIMALSLSLSLFLLSFCCLSVVSLSLWCWMILNDAEWWLSRSFMTSRSC